MQMAAVLSSSVSLSSWDRSAGLTARARAVITVRGRWIIVNNSAGVSGDEYLGKDLDHLLNLTDLVLGPIEVELSLEDTDGRGLVVLVVILVGIQNIAVGVASGTKVNQVIHRLMKQLVAELVVVRKIREIECHQRSTGWLYRLARFSAW
jgi:hypothetical protein